MKITKEKLNRHFAIRKKKIVSLFKSKRKPKTILFILGYGRSGTSILINLFAHLTYVDAYGETSKIMYHYQLCESKFKNVIINNKFELIALKPILNSCMAKDYLNKYDNSKIIWLFRDYKDVVFSGLEKFGKRVANELKEYLIDGQGKGWISRTMPNEEMEIIKKKNIYDFSTNDWMALVWWFVNHTIIRQNLTTDNRFVLIEYNDFVGNPKKYFCYFEDFAGLKSNRLHKYIDNRRKGKGKNIELSDSVIKMCDILLYELREKKLDTAVPGTASTEPS